MTSKDHDWLGQIRDIISPGRPLSAHSRDSNHKVLQIVSNDIGGWLISRGCIMSKSLRLRCPDASKVPDKFFRDFTRGYFDGDGSISIVPYSKKKNGKTYKYVTCNAYICSGSKKFINGLSDRLGEHGPPGSFIAMERFGYEVQGRRERIPKRHMMYRLTFGGKSASKFLSWMYYDGHELSMSRKRQIAESAIRHGGHWKQ